ncbi:MurR/RpiR family transcriptional regulator [Enterococcus sp. HY326]|uniref:MurR/RpiR family transcriptional regulator n=1 Tax=Enterococcus sp. HY326 TaxID=2971265 RepID=UPI002240C15F|nr:hypothetical protein [Enterococcus sp. HY326]
MLYSKLPIVLLSAIASEKNGSTNSTIATYILNHLDEMKNIGITEFAKRCNVSISSISRFCKEIGLVDFAELKAILEKSELGWDLASQEKTFHKRVTSYSKKINDSMEQVANSISQKEISQLVKDIRSFKKVAAFGLMKAETAALILQSDLLMSKKYIYTNLAYKEQMDYIETATNDTLIIIFTYTGSYFDYSSKRNFLKNKDRAKIWMICGDKINQPSYVFQQIVFESRQDYASHPYQLDFFASIIANEYSLASKDI